MKKKILIPAAILIIVSVILLWIFWGNTALIIHKITITSDRLPQSFSGYRIVQVSDLHNAEFGDKNEKLLKKIKECDPDLIAITGDLIDSNHPDIDIGVTFSGRAMEIAPCYFVTGNHDERVNLYTDLLNRLTDTGVRVLQNEAVILEKDNQRITLLGVSDPGLQAENGYTDEASVMDSVLSKMMKDVNGYSILLSHRPELFEVYASRDLDLVFSGHAHGGQFRIPFIGGLAAPGQGLFPRYDAGLYVEDHTNMVVSRGIGNSIIPLRINNRPEILLIELSAACFGNT